ncbi:SNARE protein, putative [Bodo saltans]|uniref:SNARE protein, putative n=1 Tax=Bodo saltans TaxID=75058 RepID=A0A0S4IV64_BODSA|nr:SNARE protein, putative [Bodo saltans]|eukprot:CUG02279.1 SNARE protein, putative [Bodo saltans]
MSKSLPSSSGLMKSTLRDAIKRLKKIRVKAGKNDEEEGGPAQTSGDPFRDKNNEFIKCLKRAKEQIAERNTGIKKNGNDTTTIEQSNNIRKEIKQLGVLAGEIKVMVDDAERMLAKENKKKKPKVEKVRLLERQYKERDSQHRQCLEMIELVKKMDGERLDPSGKRQGISIGQETELGKKAILREQLNLNTLRKRGERQAKRRAGATAGAAGEAGAESGTEMGEQGEEGGGRLEDDPAAKEQLKVIAQQDAEINRGLDRLRANVGKLHEIAVDIGSQLDIQNSMLDNTENTVDKQTKQLKGINRRLNKIMKDHSPINTCVTVLCIILILALVGFFLVQLDVV